MSGAFLLTDDPAGPCSYKGCRSTVSPHYSPHYFEAADIEVIEETAYARGHREGSVALLTELRAAVEGLPWTTQTDDDGGGGVLIDRSRVLALLSDAEPPR